MLQKQYETHLAGGKIPPPDSSRFCLDPPPEVQRGDLNAWQKAVDNAKAQLEHQVRVLRMQHPFFGRTCLNSLRVPGASHHKHGVADQVWGEFVVGAQQLAGSRT